MPKRNPVTVFSLVHTNTFVSSQQHMTQHINISYSHFSDYERHLEDELDKNETDYTMQFWYTDQIVSFPVENQMRQSEKHTDTDLSKAKYS